MAVVEIHVLGRNAQQSGLWMCPSCKVTPGGLSDQDAFTWQRTGMSRQEALEAMVKEHNRTVGHRARVLCGPRFYLTFGNDVEEVFVEKMPYS